MRRFKFFLLLPLVTACTGTDPRYRDTQMLERPPQLAVTKPVEEIVKDSSAVKHNIEGTELGSTVSIKSTTPPVLIIKQPFNVAWQTLGNALRADNVEVTDREHDKGRYFVTFDPNKTPEDESGFLDKTLSYLNDAHVEERYVLTVTDKGQETEVLVANNTEPKQSSNSEEQYKLTTPPADGAEKLLNSIYKTMSERPKKLDKKGHAHSN
jgi:NlpB/DapX lipoprotein